MMTFIVMIVITNRHLSSNNQQMMTNARLLIYHVVSTDRGSVIMHDVNIPNMVIVAHMWNPYLSTWPGFLNVIHNMQRLSSLHRASPLLLGPRVALVSERVKSWSAPGAVDFIRS